MNDAKRRTVILVVEVLVVSLLHLLLLYWHAGSDTMSQWLSAGEHVSYLNLTWFGLFLVVRLLAIFVLPGFVLKELGIMVLQQCLFEEESTQEQS